MKRIDAYNELCSDFGSGFARKLVSYLNSYPKIQQKFYKEGFRIVDSESMWLFLHRQESPRCLNPSCKNPAKFTSFLVGYAQPFCSGWTCCSPWRRLHGGDSPFYANSLKKKILSMRNSHDNSVNGNPKGFGFGFASRVFELDRAAFADIVRYIGPKFSPRELHDFLFPNARKHCANPSCRKPTTFHGFGYARYCANKCIFSEPGFNEKRKELWLQRTNGVYSSSAQIPEVQRRTNCTRQRNELILSGGTRTHHSQRPEVKAKIIAGMNATNLKKSGGLYMWNTEFPEFGERRAELELQRSGGKYSNVSQRPDVFEKSRRNAFAYYDVTWRGQQWQLQGYEDVALRRLTTKYKVPAKDLYVPRRGVSYATPSLLARKFYFPDLALRTNKLLIEVKSSWTGGEDGSRKLRDNIRKWGAVAKAGRALLVIFIHKVRGKKRSGVPRTGTIAQFRLFYPGGSSPWLKSPLLLSGILNSTEPKYWRYSDS